MKPGDTIESSIWLAGTETAADRTRYERDVRESIDELCDQKGFIHGPVTFTELNPGDHRVPEVPDHIHGPAVRLLVAEADVLSYRPHLSTSDRRFVGDLDRKDLERLRVITRRHHAKANPGQRLSDMECDDIIESIGPDAAMDAVRNTVLH